MTRIEILNILSIVKTGFFNSNARKIKSKKELNLQVQSTPYLSLQVLSSPPFANSFILIQVFISFIVILFFLQNAPSLTSSKSFGFREAQLLTVLTCLSKKFAISLFVTFSINELYRKHT